VFEIDGAEESVALLDEPPLVTAVVGRLIESPIDKRESIISNVLSAGYGFDGFMFPASYRYLLAEGWEALGLPPPFDTPLPAEEMEEALVPLLFPYTLPPADAERPEEELPLFEYILTTMMMVMLGNQLQTTTEAISLPREIHLNIHTCQPIQADL
jgi:hypothetical protein